MTDMPLDVFPEPPRFSFSRNFPPLRTVDPGSRLRFVTTDRGYARAVREGLVVEGPAIYQYNALTGPIAVNGAEPGDALVVRIEAIEVGNVAYVVYVNRWGASTFGMTESWIEAFRLVDGRIPLPEGQINVRPMVGCIGVAPAVGAVSSLSPASRTGGNLDLRELEPGSAMWLPVECRGGLLSVGDLHAGMGTGEPAAAGLECAGAVTVRVELAKSVGLEGPRMETATHLLFLGTDPRDVHAAKDRAVHAAWRFLVEGCAVPERRAFLICSAMLDLRFGGPAGANVLAGFEKAELSLAGVAWDVG
jgi:amidase